MTRRRTFASLAILLGSYAAVSAEPASPPAAPPAAPAPATRPAASVDEINGLVAQLGAAAAGTRDAAAARLLAIGDPALPALNEATNIAAPEVAARAKALARRIKSGRDWADGPAGEVVGGLQLRLTAVRAEVAEGEPIELAIDFHNAADAETSFDVLNGLNVLAPGRGYSSTDNRAGIKIKQLSGRAPDGGTGTKACGVRVDPIPFTLAPAATARQPVRVEAGEVEGVAAEAGKDRPLPALRVGTGPALLPGEYEVTVTCQPSSGGRGQVATNAVRVVVVEKAAKADK